MDIITTQQASRISMLSCSPMYGIQASDEATLRQKALTS